MTSTPQPFPLPPAVTAPMIAAALAEDLGTAGDLTTLTTIPADARAEGLIGSRADGCAAGVDLAARVFAAVDTSLEVEVLKGDGARIEAGDILMRVRGPARGLLTAERVALNYLGHLSGIASLTRRFVDAVDGTGARIACTRKTLPGLRAVQKFAVRCGGGHNHRFGLHDAVMVKDNHIVAAGGIAPAVAAARAGIGHTVTIEVEVDTIAQLDEALAAGADIILLDNMDTTTLRAAVQRADGRAVLEASGNVRLETVRAIAETGVDVISSGALTHSAPNLDIGMELTLDGRG
jgi:nicotinate-nucleotide pyrophosphorylase (carboxylating)